MIAAAQGVVIACRTGCEIVSRGPVVQAGLGFLVQYLPLLGERDAVVNGRQGDGSERVSCGIVWVEHSFCAGICCIGSLMCRLRACRDVLPCLTPQMHLYVKSFGRRWTTIYEQG